MRILGVDPGSHATGYGVVERVHGCPVHVAHGVLRPRRGLELAQRLALIHHELAEVAREYAPDVAVVERVFLAANPRSALVLGQARGAALAALAGAGIQVGEWSAREVKKALVGTGAATKQQVQSMVARLLDLPKPPASDAADALAVAICQTHVGRLADMDFRKGRRSLRRVAALRDRADG